MAESTNSSADAAPLSPEQVDHQMALADGTLGAAGHRVEDPAAREILRRQAAGEITGEEARRQLIANAGL